MKVKTYIDDLYYVLAGSYFVICLAMSSIIVILKVNNLYLCLGWFYILLIGVLAFFFYSRDYKFDRKYLKVRCGIFINRYAYEDMKKCYITTNNRLSYATSRKRICIKFKNKIIYISPDKMDEKLFLLIKKMGNKK